MISLTLAALCVLPTTQNAATIEHRVVNGDVYCDIQARDYPVRALMESLCGKLDLGLKGFEDIEDSPLVTVYLHDRPLNVTVEYVLGAAGLSGSVGADRIEVTSQNLAFPTREHSLQASEIAYLTALQRFPESPLRLVAREELAEIALSRSEPGKAARHYELLAEASTDHEQSVQAHMRAGELFASLRDWDRSLGHYQFVGDHELDEFSTEDEIAVVATARRELARCLAMRGESRRGYFLLRGLDEAIHPLNDKDRAERLVLMARCLVGMGDYDRALEALDRATSVGRAYVNEFEGMDLRARALEAKGRPVEAAVAWLHFSRNQDEDIKREAYRRAAEAALSAEGEELGVIFLHKQAEQEGLGDELTPYLNEARSRLGLDAVSYTEVTPTQRLRQAVQLSASGLDDQAHMKLKGLVPVFRTLSVEERIEFATTFAPLIERAEGVDLAIDLLRDVVMTLESVGNRTKLYLLAGAIYERNKRFDEAAAAYGGHL